MLACTYRRDAGMRECIAFRCMPIREYLQDLSIPIADCQLRFVNLYHAIP